MFGHCSSDCEKCHPPRKIAVLQRKIKGLWRRDQRFRFTVWFFSMLPTALAMHSLPPSAPPAAGISLVFLIVYQFCMTLATVC